ncbi:MAG: M56 family metallopeptidase [Pirellulales bacterium]
MVWWLAQNTIVASALALLVALACRAFRLSPAVRHALWLVVLVKLVLPPVVSWHPPLPGFLLAAASSARPAMQVDGDSSAGRGEPQLARSGSPAETWGSEYREFPWPAGDGEGEMECWGWGVEGDEIAWDPAYFGPGCFPEAPWAEDGAPLDGGGEPQGEIAPAGAAPLDQPPIGGGLQAQSSGAPADQAALGTTPGAASWSALLAAIWSIALWIWLAGTAVAVVIQSVRLVRLRRLLARCEPAPPWLESLVGELSAKLALRPPVVLDGPNGSTPMVCSLFRPTLVWPRPLTDHLPARCRRAVLVHELAHLRRRDHWVGWLELLAGCAWWWNPLFWYVRHQLREAAELACDAWVVAALPEGRRVYAEALIEVSSLVSFAAAPVPAVGMGSSARRTFERRLHMILRERVRCRVPVAGLAAIGLLALAVMPGWTQGQATSEATVEQAASPSDQGDAEIFVTTAAPPDAPLNERTVETVEFVQGGEREERRVETVESVQSGTLPAVEASLVFEPAQAIDSQPGVPGRPTFHVRTVQAAHAAAPAQLQSLEARLEQLLAEVRALRAGGGPQATAAYPATRSVRVNLPHVIHATPTLHVARVAGAGDMQMLSRAKYRLPEGKAEALAAFIQEHVKAEVDTKVDGEVLIITAEPHAQTAIAQFIRLMDPRQPTQARNVPTPTPAAPQEPGTALPAAPRQSVVPPPPAAPSAPATEPPVGRPNVPAADPFGSSGGGIAPETPAAEPASPVDLPTAPATP